jgi:hypothetical protein
VGAADERQQMVFAQRVELDVAHHHHLVVVGREDRAVDDRVEVLSIPLGEEGHGTRRTGGGIEQAVARRIFADGLDHRTVELFHWTVTGKEGRAIIPQPRRSDSSAA